MMAITKKQIELEVRANNLSNKSLGEVINNVNDLSDALEKQAKLAEQGQGSVDELSKTYDKLGKAGNALIAQTAVIERVNNLRDAMDAAELKVRDTAKALETYKTSISDVGERTAAQTKELKALETAARQSEKALASQSDRFAKASADAAAIGLNMENWAQAQDDVAEAAKRLNAIQSKTSANLDNYRTQIVKVTAEQENLEKSLRRSKEADYARLFDEIAAAEADVAKQAALLAKEQADLEKSLCRSKEADYERMFDEIAAAEKEAAKQAEILAKEQEQLEKSFQDFEAARAFEEMALAEKEAARQAEFLRNEQENLERSLRRAKEADYARMFDELEAAEKEAKAATSSLESELRKLGTTTDAATDKQKRLAHANIAAAKAAKDGNAASMGLLGAMSQLQKTIIGGERTTLSFFQRMRGEILATAAAFIGFQGAIQLATTSLEAFRQKQATQTKLLVATGNDTQLAASEYRYLGEQADFLGIRMRDLAKGYSEFRIAAKDTNMSLQDTRFIFESVSAAGVKLNLSVDSIQGINKALTQLVSKGVASTEELGQQLGDHLPGVMQVAAKQFGVTVAEFRKQLESGNVDAVKAAMALARGLNDSFAEISIDKSMTAVEGRFGTALDRWKVMIAESGLVEAYTDMLKKLTELMGSAAGAELAQGIGATFAAIVKVVIVLADNIEVVKFVLAELATLFGVFVAIRFAGWVSGVTASLGMLTSTLTGGLIPALTATSLLLGAILVLPIAVWAYNEFEPFRKIVDLTLLGVRALWEGVALGAKTLASAIRNAPVAALSFLLGSFQRFFVFVLEGLSDLADKFGARGLVKAINQVRDALSLPRSTFLDELDKNVATAKRELASLQRLAGGGISTSAKPTEGGVINPITGAPLVKKPKREVTATADSGTIDTEFGVKADKAKQAAEKYSNLIESLQNQVSAVTATSQKKDSDNLEVHLAGIEKQYEGLFTKLKDLSAADEKRLTSQLRTAVDKLKFEAEQTYWEKQLSAVDAVKKKFAEMDAQLSKGGAEGDRGRMLAAITEQFRQMREEVEKIDPSKVGDLFAKLADYEAQVKAKAESTFDFSTAKDAASAVDVMVEQRNAKIAAAQTEEARGIITYC